MPRTNVQVIDFINSQLSIDGVEIMQYLQHCYEKHPLCRPQSSASEDAASKNVRSPRLSCSGGCVRVDRIVEVSRHLEPRESCRVAFLECNFCDDSGCGADTYFMHIRRHDALQEESPSVHDDGEEWVQWAWKIPLTRLACGSAQEDDFFQHAVVFEWNQYRKALGFDGPPFG